MNRVKKISKGHAQLRPYVDRRRQVDKLTKTYVFILQQMTKKRLIEAAKSLQVPGRSTMDSVELIEATAERAAMLSVQAGDNILFTGEGHAHTASGTAQGSSVS